MLFSGIPHLPIFLCHLPPATWPPGHLATCHLATWSAKTIGKRGIPENSIQNVAQLRWNYLRRTLQSKVMDGFFYLEIAHCILHCILHAVQKSLRSVPVTFKHSCCICKCLLLHHTPLPLILSIQRLANQPCVSPLKFLSSTSIGHILRDSASSVD